MEIIFPLCIVRKPVKLRLYRRVKHVDAFNRFPPNLSYCNQISLLLQTFFTFRPLSIIPTSPLMPPQEQGLFSLYLSYTIGLNCIQLNVNILRKPKPIYLTRIWQLGLASMLCNTIAIANALIHDSLDHFVPRFSNLVDSSCFWVLAMVWEKSNKNDQKKFIFIAVMERFRGLKS